MISVAVLACIALSLGIIVSLMFGTNIHVKIDHEKTTKHILMKKLKAFQTEFNSSENKLNHSMDNNEDVHSGSAINNFTYKILNSNMFEPSMNNQTVEDDFTFYEQVVAQSNMTMAGSFCTVNFMLFGINFVQKFQYVYIGLYVVCFAIVVTLYVLLFISVTHRRKMRTKRRKTTENIMGKLTVVKTMEKVEVERSVNHVKFMRLNQGNMTADTKSNLEGERPNCQITGNQLKKDETTDLLPKDGSTNQLRSDVIYRVKNDDTTNQLQNEDRNQQNEGTIEKCINETTTQQNKDTTKQHRNIESEGDLTPSTKNQIYPTCDHDCNNLVDDADKDKVILNSVAHPINADEINYKKLSVSEFFHAHNNVTTCNYKIVRNNSRTALNANTKQINNTATRRRRSLHRDSQLIANLKTALMLFVVTVVFIITYLPAFLLNVQVLKYNVIVYYLYFANNVANPFIYSFMNEKFREGLARLFLRIKCTGGGGRGGR